MEWRDEAHREAFEDAAERIAEVLAGYDLGPGPGRRKEIMKLVRAAVRAARMGEHTGRSETLGADDVDDLSELAQKIAALLADHAQPILAALESAGIEIPGDGDEGIDIPALHAAIAERFPNTSSYLDRYATLYNSYAGLSQDVDELASSRALADEELAVLETRSRELPRVMTVEQAAEVIEVHPETIRRAIRSGELNAAKIGRDYRITRDALSQWFVERGGQPLHRAPAAFQPTPANIRQAAVAWLVAHELPVDADSIDRVSAELDGYTGGVLGLDPLAHLDMMREHGVLDV